MIAGVGLALASLDTPERTPPGLVHVSPFVRPARFFIGAWVGPPTSTTDPKVWRRFGGTGLEVSLRGLEDPNDRARNLKTLALLDSLGLGFVPRDDAVHPDELSRPGWRDRIRDVVRAYRGHRATFAYFLCDEPRSSAIDSVATLAAAFAEEDPQRSAYVNVLPLPSNASDADQRRWREEATRLITRGKLRLWSWSAYSQWPWGEDAAFLLCQRNALEVGRATGMPAFAILQFTGFQGLEPLPRAQMDYLVAESIAHGACGISWFTYWTPNPDEPVQQWRGGAVEYDGTPSPRADTLRAVNAYTRRLASAFPSSVAEVVRVAHFGTPMPRGSRIPSDAIPGLRGVDGGPATVAGATWGAGGNVCWLVINRDRGRSRTLTVLLKPEVGVADVLDPAEADTTVRHLVDPAKRSVILTLTPGGSAVLGIVRR